jgi:hypothetical protein
MAAISFPAELYDELSEHLSRYAESVAFMLAAPPDNDGVLRVQELRIVANEVPSPQPDHCEINDALRGEIIQWAWNSGGCLIEAHSHGTLLLPARFSRFDIMQLSEWVPHVRWRLRGRPYVALVTASREIDGLVWIDDRLEAVDALLVDGQAPIQTTGLSMRDLERPRAR